LSSHPKTERDQEAHLNYYASAYNRGRQLSHRKTKLNKQQRQQKNKHASLTKNTENINTNKLNPGLVASYDLRPGNGAGPIFWKVRDRRRDRREGKKKKGRKKIRKGKHTKNTNNTHTHTYTAPKSTSESQAH